MRFKYALFRSNKFSFINSRISILYNVFDCLDFSFQDSQTHKQLLYNKDYGKTTAVVKSTDKFCRKSVICYNVGEREIFVTVPYYISHETISVIYMRCRYNKVIVDCPKLQHKAIIKNFIISTIIFISGFVIVNIMFGLLK